MKYILTLKVVIESESNIEGVEELTDIINEDFPTMATLNENCWNENDIQFENFEILECKEENE
jgi:hypothetical protein